MSINALWDETLPYPTICYVFSGLWSWDELNTTHQDVFELIKEKEDQVGVIFDMTNSLELPVGALNATRRMLTFAPQNFGVIIVVTSDAVAQDTFTMLGKFDDSLASRITIANTLEEAHSILTQYYASHPN